MRQGDTLIDDRLVFCIYFCQINGHFFFFMFRILFTKHSGFKFYHQLSSTTKLSYGNSNENMSRFSALSYTKPDDLNVVMNLVQELSLVLTENRSAANELLAFADSLDTDDDDETDSESTSGAAPAQSTSTPLKKSQQNQNQQRNSSAVPSSSSLNKRPTSAASFSTTDTEQNDHLAPTGAANTQVSSLLARENASLQTQVSAQRSRNRALARLLLVTQHTLDHAVTGLRTLVHSHTHESLEIHKRYIAAIHAEQAVSIELELQNAELETHCLAMSNALRDTLRISSVPAGKASLETASVTKAGQKTVELADQGRSSWLDHDGDYSTSADFVMGMLQIMKEGAEDLKNPQRLFLRPELEQQQQQQQEQQQLELQQQRQQYIQEADQMEYYQ